MATYLILNLCMLSLVVLISGLRARHLHGRLFLLIGALCLLTAVFDSLMIAIGAFTYPEHLIIGWRIGLAPIEDFFYPVAAGCLVVGLMERKRKEQPI